jgi:hypothetical protein
MPIYWKYKSFMTKLITFQCLTNTATTTAAGGYELVKTRNSRASKLHGTPVLRHATDEQEGVLYLL